MLLLSELVCGQSEGEEIVCSLICLELINELGDNARRKSDALLLERPATGRSR
jgi:hypothetical protein